MADLTVYVPDEIAERARAAGIPLSRSMREILLAVLAVIEHRDPPDPIANVLDLMADKGVAPQDRGTFGPSR